MYLDNDKPYTDNTYVIVEINKNVSDVDIELAENNYSNLLKVLEDEDKQKAVSWGNTSIALNNIAIQRSQIINFSKAKEILSYLKTKEGNKYEKRNQAKELMTMIANSVDDNGNTEIIDSTSGKSYALTDEQIKYVLKNLGDKITNISDFNSLQTKNIKQGFQQGGNDSIQMEILQLITPI